MAKVAEELVKWISRVGIPQEVFTDQNTSFISGVLRGMRTMLKVRQLRTSVYHPKTDGLVERFCRTLKGML